MAAKPVNKSKPVKNSRSQRAKSAKSTKKSAVVAATKDEQSQPKPVARRKVPNVLVLTKRTAEQLWQYKLPLAGIALVYGILNIIFVTGMGGGLDVAAIRNEYTGRLVGSLAAYTQLIGDSTASSTSSSSVYQIVLFLIVSLALIWALRQLRNGEKIRIRDAFYQGMYPLIPFVLVVIVLCLQLLPLVAGSAVYQIVISAGIAVSFQEVVGWGIGAVALMLLSIYFIAASIIALYIVTLPDMTPMRALRSAREVVKGRRWLVVRKALFLPIALFVVGGVLVLPIILLVPVAAQWLVLLMGPVALTIIHTYMYNLYRELIGD